jgi:hypothetical protein
MVAVTSRVQEEIDITSPNVENFEVTGISEPQAQVGSNTLNGDLVFGDLSRFTTSVQAIMRASLRPNTVRQYQTYNLRFLEWKIQARNDDPLSAAMLFEYLSFFACSRFTFGYVRSMYSSLRYFMSRQYPQIKFEPADCDMFLKGAANSCKRKMRKNYTWDPQQYVEYLLRKKLPLRVAEAAQEAATVLALASALRGADLLNLGSEVTFSEDSMEIPFLDRAKTRVHGEDVPSEVVARYTDSQRVCPVYLVNRYLTLSNYQYGTKGWVRPKTLFVSSTAPQTVKIITLRGWLRNEIAAAGIRDPDGNLYGAHSTRVASTSDAYFRGYTFDRINALVGWATNSTFMKIYNRPVLRRPENLLPPITSLSVSEISNDLLLASLEEEEISGDKLFCFSCFLCRCFTPLVCAEKLRILDSLAP